MEFKPCVNKKLTGRINAFFKRAYRYGFTTKIMEVTSLLDNAGKYLFCNVQKAHHCLYGILPAENEHEICKRGHNFVLPHCTSNLFKASFLNRCLFSLI